MVQGTLDTHRRINSTMSQHIIKRGRGEDADDENRCGDGKSTMVADTDDALGDGDGSSVMVADRHSRNSSSHKQCDEPTHR